MTRRKFATTLAGALPLAAQTRSDVPVDALEDKIRGGFLGQAIGDLNGLPHEMKYIAEPGAVERYTPALPDGAWTDDDTDVEWPYVLEMQRSGEILLPYERVALIWKRHINRRIWCSHLYLRQLLEIGIEPPLTGSRALNPWAEFNLSGQFVSETWGLVSPGMPQTAARIAAHYTRVSVDGEPIQSAQMTAAMIATAFVTGDLERILDAGEAAADGRSVMREIVSDVRRWGREHPGDWRRTRALTKEKYCRYGGQDVRDRNGVWLNGASTIGALIYGRGDFVDTLRLAFNFGWDADNNAAACGTILGVVKGHRWLMGQGWNIKDQYRNTSRDGLPQDETISSYAARLVDLARKNISRRGGAAERPANVEPLVEPERHRATLRDGQRARVARDLGGTPQERARAAYLGICLDLAAELAERHPQAWRDAVAVLAGYPKVVSAMFYEAPIPAGEEIRRKAAAAGLAKPATRVRLAG
jgi:hypothetical protein